MARKDKGRIYLTERDRSVLTWIGEQYGTRLDQVQFLLGRQAQATTLQEGVVALTTARQTIQRWLKAGWAEWETLVYREPGWVWLSHTGLRELELSYRYWRPTLGGLNHFYWINQARLYVEGKRPDCLWVGERDLRLERSGKKGHVVDAEIHVAEGTIGVEVELTRKSARAVWPILQRLARDYGTVWYFTTDVTKRAVSEAVRQLPQEHQVRFRIYHLEQLE